MDRALMLPIFREKIKNLIDLNDDEWDVFIDFLKIKRIKKNDCFAEEGKTCREIGFIMKGAVRYCNIVKGKEITGYFSFENNFVTAIKSYLTEEPCLYNIKTLEDSYFVTISRKNMQAMLKIPLLSCKIERFGRLLSERFNILFEDRLKSFVIKTAEERYRDLLESGNDIVNRIPVQYIAQFIGITPVSLSRIRKKILTSTASSHKADS
ncbi:MAG TPA: cyclic nucleotide-binding domain-containing protein [Sediminibacterium sp.]